MPLLSIPLVLAASSAALALRRLHLLATADCDLHTHASVLRPSRFRHKVVWLTGATSGIGLELAKQLAVLDARLILSARDEAALRDVASSLSCPSSHVRLLPMDLTDTPQHLRHMAKKAVDMFDRVDYLFNNAGVTSRASVAHLDPNVVSHILAVNFSAPVALASALLPALTASHGTIVNTLSIAAFIHTPLRAPYSGAKSALASYMRCLQLEHADVRVVNVYPGSVDTMVARNALDANGKPFAHDDPNTLAGLKSDRVAHLMLTAVSNDLSEPVIAKPKEMMAVRLSRWCPPLWNRIAVRRAAGYRANMLSYTTATTSE